MDWRTPTIAITRYGMAWIFLWPFLDKLLGLGYAVSREDAWVRGGSPTYGFLTFGTDANNPLHGAFAGIAGHPVADWLFMIGLLGIGLALALGIGMRIACWSGFVMLMLMWIAILPMDAGTDHNPFWDDHIMYAVFLLAFLAIDAGKYWGLGERWESLPFVQRFPWLR